LDSYDLVSWGNIVVVDILIEKSGKGTYGPPTKDGQGPLVAHFARVTGVDFENKMVNLENTLGANQADFTYTYTEFMKAWNDPEGRAANKPLNVDKVQNWAFVITP
jgi:hypothetical protein